MKRIICYLSLKNSLPLSTLGDTGSIGLPGIRGPPGLPGDVGAQGGAMYNQFILSDIAQRISLAHLSN